MIATDKQTGEKRRPKRGADGKFTAGGGGGPGRPKGTPNKASAAAKEAIWEAFEARGGVDFLMKLDDAVFCRLLALLIPKAHEHTGTDDGPITVNFGFRRPPQDADAVAAEDGPAPEAGEMGS